MASSRFRAPSILEGRPGRAEFSVLDEKGEPWSEAELRDPKRAWRKLLAFYGRKGGDVCVRFVSDAEIRGLKRRFFGVDKRTDVLSFPSDEGVDCGGDIAISRSVVKKDALADGRDEAEALGEILLHGFLHLMGMEHDYSVKGLAAVSKLHESHRDVWDALIRRFAKSLVRPAPSPAGTRERPRPLRAKARGSRARG